MVSEGRSFTICLFALASFMCGMIVRSLVLVYSDTEPPQAVDFEAAVVKDPPGTFDTGCVGTMGPVLGKDFWNQPLGMGIRTEEDCRDYTTIDATVSQRGYDYTGTCEGVLRDDGGAGDSVCDAGRLANEACRDVLRAEFPRIGRRRLMENHDEDQAPAEGRELRGARPETECLNIYVPWVVVAFSDPETGNPFTRCSYNLGTKGNSATRDWAVVQATPAMGSHIGVWDVEGPSDTRCVVGWANRTTLTSFTEESGKSNEGMTPMIGLFIFITICTFVLCIKTALTHDEEAAAAADKSKTKGANDVEEDEGSEE